ncbi:MAG: hypothetical protein U0R64_03845 [Candidatus Nanopelagicales bacterium]
MRSSVRRREFAGGVAADARPRFPDVPPLFLEEDEPRWFGLPPDFFATSIWSHGTGGPMSGMMLA